MLAHLSIPEAEIDAICQKHGIRRVWLFGSVLRDDFTNDSDVDILVEFAPESQPTLARLLAVENEFRKLFQRQVDLGDYEAVRSDPNYIRRSRILNSAQVIYER